ncbi:MAG: carboxypeptidase-like regulatory domain-containing protein [Elusimicrobia bacterium]|nr:carboxypeptidase-like regulatory domain-containing protein [Elusimicrobiota bacterium]
MLNRKGATFIELMIAVAVITFGVLASMGAFKYINMAISQARLKTIATNLAQEKMEMLKNKSYYQLLVTVNPAVSSGYSPNFVYDSSNYPPEIFAMWGSQAFTRVVNVDYASVSGTSVSTVPYSSDDPGMKRITVYVLWSERGVKKKVQLDSYYQNPDAVTLNSGFNGTVTISGGGNLAGALVQVIGSPRWKGYSGSDGKYTFQVVTGSYTLVCSSAGFYSNPTSAPVYVADGAYTAQNFSLVRIGTGTVGSASVYTVSPGLLISQVVASTVQAPGSFDAQYIELFNPTTAAITVGSSISAHSINLNIASTCGAARTCQDVNLNYVNTSVAPGGYYLIANRSSVTVMGTNYTADAYYTDTANISCSPAPPDWSAPLVKRLIQSGHNGAVWLTDSGGNPLDAVGWTHESDPAQCEGNCIPFNGGATPHGLLQGDQIVRFSTPCAVGITYGRAYDSGNNATSFYYNNALTAAGISYKPFSRSSSLTAQTILSGAPATSAYVFADDGQSAAALAFNSSVTGAQGQVCPVSSFTLVGVATGTWKVTVVSGNYMQTISTVIVTQNVSTGVPNGITVSSWPASGFSYTALTSTYTGGLASGFVYGVDTAYTAPLAGKTVWANNGASTVTDAKGWYLLALPVGTAALTANYNSADSSYGTSDAIVNITQGAVTTVPDFHLSRVGVIKGYVTPGTGALPNITVTAILNQDVYQDVSDNTGYFYINAPVSASYYTVTPELDPLQTYTTAPTSPLLALVTTAGGTVQVGTITVVGGMGTITGSVTNGGAAITTGVLIVASTAAVPDPLPAVYAQTSPAQTILYSVSSQADGTYSLDVRSGGTYQMRAFYPMVNVQTGSVSYTSKTLSSVVVIATATATGKNFTWP